jgi:hypothetical protein
MYIEKFTLFLQIFIFAHTSLKTAFFRPVRLKSSKIKCLHTLSVG